MPNTVYGVNQGVSNLTLKQPNPQCNQGSTLYISPILDKSLINGNFIINQGQRDNLKELVLLQACCKVAEYFKCLNNTINPNSIQELITDPQLWIERNDFIQEVLKTTEFYIYWYIDPRELKVEKSQSSFVISLFLNSYIYKELQTPPQSLLDYTRLTGIHFIWPDFSTYKQNIYTKQTQNAVLSYEYRQIMAQYQKELSTLLSNMSKNELLSIHNCHRQNLNTPNELKYQQIITSKKSSFIDLPQEKQQDGILVQAISSDSGDNQVKRYSWESQSSNIDLQEYTNTDLTTYQLFEASIESSSSSSSSSEQNDEISSDEQQIQEEWFELY